MPFVCIGDVVLVVAWLTIIVIAQGTAVRTKEISDRDIVLAGLCDEFVDAVEEMEQEYRARKMRARRHRDDDEEEDEEPRPRKKRSSTEVQGEEPRPRKMRPASDEIED